MNSAILVFEKFMIENVPAAINAQSFARNEDGTYQNVIVCGHYAVWEAARADFQAQLDDLQETKNLDRPVKFSKGCDCGCNSPAFTTPFGALRFLMNRMHGNGVGQAVAESYAWDIMQILRGYDAVVSDDHLSVVSNA